MALISHLVHYVVDGPKLKATRRGLRMTQKDVAGELSVHAATIHRLETGKAGSLSLVKEVCELYGIPYRSVVRLRRIPDGRGRRA